MTYKSPSRHHDPETNIDDKELEAKLRHYSPPPPSDLLQARILKIASQHAQHLPDTSIRTDSGFRTHFGKWAAAVLMILGVGILGLGSGGLGITDRGARALGSIQNTLTVDLQSDRGTQDIWMDAAVDLGVAEIFAWVEQTEYAPVN